MKQNKTNIHNIQINEPSLLDSVFFQRVFEIIFDLQNINRIIPTERKFVGKFVGKLIG